METRRKTALTAGIEAAMAGWPAVEPFLAEPRCKTDHQRLLAALDMVLDAGGADESHPLAGLADRLGQIIASYEQKQAVTREMSVPDLLRQIMKQHRLRQADLPEIGPQSVVSDVLRGKRQLNVGQISRLSRRFGLPADVFLP